MLSVLIKYRLLSNETHLQNTKRGKRKWWIKKNKPFTHQGKTNGHTKKQKLNTKTKISVTWNGVSATLVMSGGSTYTSRLLGFTTVGVTWSKLALPGAASSNVCHDWSTFICANKETKQRVSYYLQGIYFGLFFKVMLSIVLIMISKLQVTLNSIYSSDCTLSRTTKNK